MSEGQNLHPKNILIPPFSEHVSHEEVWGLAAQYDDYLIFLASNFPMLLPPQIYPITIPSALPLGKWI